MTEINETEEETGSEQPALTEDSTESSDSAEDSSPVVRTRRRQRETSGRYHFLTSVRHNRVRYAEGQTVVFTGSEAAELLEKGLIAEGPSPNFNEVDPADFEDGEYVVKKGAGRLRRNGKKYEAGDTLLLKAVDARKLAHIVKPA